MAQSREWEGRTGTGTGTGTERSGQHGQNRTSNRERERMTRVGQAAGRGEKKGYIGQGCARLPGILSGGGCQSGLGPIILETA